MTDAALPIGVFDSGVGGLTVLNALREKLPGENLIYLGDTARVPYGTKSSLSVTRYAEQAAACLIDRKIKLLVIACNTASAVAVEPLQQKYPLIPVMGVVGPGADACCAVSKNRHIGVIATESTVNNQAYQQAILKRMPDASVAAQSCSLFVALAEEGWHEGELVEQIVAKCLAPLKQIESPAIDTLVLGCTHFPALKECIGKVMGADVVLVDSAQTTAEAVREELQRSGMLNQADAGDVEFLVTDDPQRFSRVAEHFFEGELTAGEIQQVDIQHFDKG
ncbi:glutamate racemase [uncultured Neptuniibacter sp.]|uniref:glutamate racemase n=1 Tax=uncultured Neptuniibacter sp. TaxID=502143 RepID=UPI002636B69B|nr:glutamate racemase [uncultured Neptuniibacter sp.]